MLEAHVVGMGTIKHYIGLSALIVVVTAACSSGDQSGDGQNANQNDGFNFGGSSNGGSSNGMGASGSNGVGMCGNGVREGSEDCDTNDFGGATCESATMGMSTGGSLRCSSQCTLDTTACTGQSNPAGTGGGPSMGTGGSMQGGGGVPSSNGGTNGGGSGGMSAANGETGRMVGMTAAINAIRAQVSPNNPLPDMAWSPQIAQVAQTYADKLASQGCQIAHSHTPGYGENLASFNGQAATASQVAGLWASEGDCYNYGPISLNDSCPCVPASGGECGHYTQLVWRGTTEVGCGVATCPGAEVWVCNFQPQGNILGQPPY